MFGVRFLAFPRPLHRQGRSREGQRSNRDPVLTRTGKRYFGGLDPVAANVRPKVTSGQMEVGCRHKHNVYERQQPFTVPIPSAPTLMTNAAFRTTAWDMRFHVPVTAFKDKQKANKCVIDTNHNCHPDQQKGAGPSTAMTQPLSPATAGSQTCRPRILTTKTVRHTAVGQGGCG